MAVRRRSHENDRLTDAAENQERGQALVIEEAPFERTWNRSVMRAICSTSRTLSLTLTSTSSPPIPRSRLCRPTSSPRPEAVRTSTPERSRTRGPTESMGKISVGEMALLRHFAGGQRTPDINDSPVLNASFPFAPANDEGSY